MPPRRQRAKRAEVRDEVREAHQEPQIPPPEMISTTQVEVIVAQAVEIVMMAMIAHFSQPSIAPTVKAPV